MNPDSSSESTPSADDLDATIRVDVRATLPAGIEQPGDMIGRYKLIEPLGQGGFGSVWRAEQHEPIHREVALKLIKAGMDSRDIIARFSAERQALAMMDHPNIAAVLDAGTTENGRPFFAMELVKGVPLTDFCDARKLTIRERLDLFIPVCQAVQHAHQKAILHRDLKPSNILVMEVDGHAVPKVIDFGIAKALGGTEERVLQDSLARTRAGMIIGTPQYMSPEQAGAAPDLDTRSDIYTLGVILCELLTGDTPLSRETLRSAAMDEVMRMIREVDPKRISARMTAGTELLRKTAAARSTDPGKLRQTLRGDLDWITLKALEKERERRYGSAAALALDLQRYLNAEPVEAGPPSAAYRFRKMVQRNRLAVGAAAAMVLLLVAGIAASTWQAVRANRAERASQERSDELRITLATQYVDNGTRGLQSRTYPLAFYWFVRALELNEGDPAREKHDRMRVANTWRRMPRLTAILFHDAPLSHAEFSADGTRIATSSYDKTARIWDAETGEPVGMVLQHDNYVYDVRFSPDGQLVATGSADGTARIWDAATGEPVTAPLLHANAVNHVEFSADASMLVTACAGRDHYRPPPGGITANPPKPLNNGSPCALVWHRLTGQVVPLRMPSGAQPFTACFSEDGQYVATGAWQKDVVALWDPQTGEMKHGPFIQPKTTNYDGILIQALLSPDNRFLATGSGEHVTRVWDVEKKQIVGTLKDTRVSRESKFLDDTHLSIEGQVWNFQTGQLADRENAGKDGTAKPIPPNVSRLVLSDVSGGVKLHDAGSGLDLSSHLPGWPGWGSDMLEPVNHVSPDNRRLLIESPDERQGAVFVWDRVGDTPSARPLRHWGDVENAQFYGNGQNLVTSCYQESGMKFWDIQFEGQLLSREAHNVVWDVTVNPQQSEMLSYGGDGVCRRWSLPGGRAIGKPLVHGRPVASAEFAPDGSRLFTIDYRQDQSMYHLHGWFLSSDEECWPPVENEPGSGISVSKDGRWVGSYGGRQNHVRIIDAQTGQDASPLLKHDYWCKAPAFHPHRPIVATPGGDFVVRIWELPSGKPLKVLKHEGTVNEVRFTPDGAQLLAATSHGLVRWDTKSWTQIGPVVLPAVSLEGMQLGIETDWGALAQSASVVVREFHSGKTLGPGFPRVEGSRMDPLGRHLLTWNPEGSCRKWDLRPDTRPVAQLRRLAQILLTQEADAYGELTSLPGPELKRLWESYKAESPKELRFSETQRLIWLEEEASRLHEGGFYAQELEVLNAATKIQPDDLYLLGLRGEVAALNGHKEAAINDLTRVIAAGLGCKHNLTTWEAAHDTPSRVKQGFDDLSKRLANDPKNGYLWRCRGQLAMSLRQWQTAAADLGKAIEFGCEPAATYQRAWCLVALGKWEEASRQGSAAAEFYPRWSYLNNARCSIALKVNDRKMAAKIYQDELAWLTSVNSFNNIEAQSANGLAWIQAVHLRNDPSKARSLAELAVKKEPTNWIYLTTLAAALLRNRDFPRAKEKLDQAIGMGGEFAQSLRSLPLMAMIQHELKKPEEAKASLEAARKLHQSLFSKPFEYDAKYDWQVRLNVCQAQLDLEALLREAESRIEGKNAPNPNTTPATPRAPVKE